MYKILEWLFGNIIKDIYKNEFKQFQERLLEIEKEHRVINKCIDDNKVRIDKLEEKVEKGMLLSAKLEGALETIMLLAKNKREDRLEDNYGHTDRK